jgi:GntR family histidine utilization transcriptional repressor
MGELAADGIVERKRRAGTRVKASPTRQAKFVIPVIREEIASTGVEYRYALVKREKPETPDWLRARINLEAGAEVLHLQCMHYGGNKPFQFEERWINLQAVPQAAHHDFKSIGPNDWLVNEVPFTEAELTFSASNASTEIAKFLSVSEGQGLFTIERTTWLDKLPVTYARLYFASGYSMTTRI